MRYKIIVKELKEYSVTKTVYEGEDGKRYVSTYGMPENLKYETKKVETGETGYTDREAYTQEVDDLSLKAVIEAVNGL